MTDAHRHDDHTRGIPATAAIHGHPIHPALIPLPIGLLITAFVTDVLYWSTSSRFWAEMSFWLLAAGVATGIIAASAGLVDFLTIRRARAHRAEWIHLIGNVTAILVASI